MWVLCTADNLRCNRLDMPGSPHRFCILLSMTNTKRKYNSTLNSKINDNIGIMEIGHPPLPVNYRTIENSCALSPHGYVVFIS